MKFIYLILITNIINCYERNINTPKIDFNKIKYLTIEPYMINHGKKTNAYINTNKEEIEILLKNANIIYNDHACGYHWIIRLWENSLNNEKSYLINKDCTPVPENIKKIINKLENNEYSSLYLLKINSKIEPTEIFKILKKTGYLGFLGYLDSNTYANLPIGRFRISAENSEDKEKELETEKIYKEFSNILAAKPEYILKSTKYSKKIIKKEWEVLIYLKYGTKINADDNLFKKYESLDIKYPNYYYVRIISNESLKNINAKLSKYKFIQEIMKPEI